MTPPDASALAADGPASVSSHASSHVRPAADAPICAPRVPVSPAARALARRAVPCALVLGVLADVLLRAPLGLNVLLLVGALATALAWLARWRGRAITGGAVLLGALALLFAGALTWRDSAMLTALDLLALWTVLCALAGALLHGDALPIEHAGAFDYARGAARVALHTASGAAALTSHAEIGELATPAARRGAGTVARGVALAAPALVVFGLLFAAADARFADGVRRLVEWDAWRATSHVVVTAVAAWLAAGYLRASLADATDDGPALALPRPRAFGARETCVALALVDALFAAFVLVQLRWLFGGAATIADGGVTYAEYARHGFFELVAVAALTLPTLLGAHACVAADAAASRTTRRAFRAVAGALVALVLVIVVSAGDRMRLYVDAYGLTESRFYAAAFMTWLAAVLAWAGVALLRDRVATFAVGALATAWLAVLALNVANPDARIVAVNAARVADGKSLDVSYVATLSADAVPALVAQVLPTMAARPFDPAACIALDAARGARRAWSQPSDWRGWNGARARAREVAGEVSAALVARCDAAGSAHGAARTVSAH